VGSIVSALIVFVIAPQVWGGAGAPPFWFELLFSAVLLSFGGVPTAVGFAVLRYRLYDLDVLVNRTLVYGSLTAVLAALYLGGVAAAQLLFRTFTGEGSQLAVVASTLAIAALFNPLRRRVQALIDRLFYRKKYDAAKTLEAFSARLREETDLESLGGRLVAVVRETMQPEHASLWLRDPGENGGEERSGEVRENSREDRSRNAFRNV
jgi:hypothetical protein